MSPDIVAALLTLVGVLLTPIITAWSNYYFIERRTKQKQKSRKRLPRSKLADFSKKLSLDKLARSGENQAHDSNQNQGKTEKSRNRDSNAL